MSEAAVNIQTIQHLIAQKLDGLMAQADHLGSVVNYRDNREQLSVSLYCRFLRDNIRALQQVSTVIKVFEVFLAFVRGQFDVHNMNILSLYSPDSAAIKLAQEVQLLLVRLSEFHHTDTKSRLLLSGAMSNSATI